MGRIMGKEDKGLDDKQTECADTRENCGVMLNKLISRK